MVTLQSTKRHLRIDDAAEDAHVKLLIAVAAEYVTKATGIENDTDAPFAYDMCCLLLIANWYANRESAGDLKQQLPHGFNMLLSSIMPGNKYV